MTKVEWERELVGVQVGEASILCEMEGYVLRVIEDDGVELEQDADHNATRVNVQVDNDIVVGVESVS